jgi:RNA polymerase sigma factor (sigma-70 family)
MKNTTELVETHADYLFNFALSKTSNRDLSLDLVQDALLAGLENLNRFEGRSSLRTWLTSILNRKILDHWRKLKTSSKLNSDLPEGIEFKDEELLIYEQIVLGEKEDALFECLNELTPEWRKVMEAKFFEEKKGDEICKELNLTKSNFWVIVHRAKAQLLECLTNKKMI